MGSLITPLVAGGVILLLVLMAVRELTAPLRGEWGRFSRGLNVAILPLLAAFAVTIVAIVVSFVRGLKL